MPTRVDPLILAEDMRYKFPCVDMDMFNLRNLPFVWCVSLMTTLMAGEDPGPTVISGPPCKFSILEPEQTALFDTFTRETKEACRRLLLSQRAPNEQVRKYLVHCPAWTITRPHSLLSRAETQPRDVQLLNVAVGWTARAMELTLLTGLWLLVEDQGKYDAPMRVRRFTQQIGELLGDQARAQYSVMYEEMKKKKQDAASLTDILRARVSATEEKEEGAQTPPSTSSPPPPDIWGLAETFRDMQWTPSLIGGLMHMPALLALATPTLLTTVEELEIQRAADGGAAGGGGACSLREHLCAMHARPEWFRQDLTVAIDHFGVDAEDTLALGAPPGWIGARMSLVLLSLHLCMLFVYTCYEAPLDVEQEFGRYVLGTLHPGFGPLELALNPASFLRNALSEVVTLQLQYSPTVQHLHSETEYREKQHQRPAAAAAPTGEKMSLKEKLDAARSAVRDAKAFADPDSPADAFFRDEERTPSKAMRHWEGAGLSPPLLRAKRLGILIEAMLLAVDHPVLLSAASPCRTWPGLSDETRAAMMEEVFSGKALSRELNRELLSTSSYFQRLRLLYVTVLDDLRPWLFYYLAHTTKTHTLHGCLRHSTSIVERMMHVEDHFDPLGAMPGRTTGDIPTLDIAGLAMCNNTLTP